MQTHKKNIFPPIIKAEQITPDIDKSRTQSRPRAKAVNIPNADCTKKISTKNKAKSSSVPFGHRIYSEKHVSLSIK